MKGNMSQTQKKADHSTLLNRNKENQHSIGAIEGLQEILDKEQESISNLQKSIDEKVSAERKVNGQALDKDVEIKNVESADKLKTARTIGLSGAVTSTPTNFDGSGNVNIPVHSVKEAYLEWGGRHQGVNLSPIDIALLPELNANRLAFIPDSCVKFERSADAGASWSDVSADFDGTMLCTDYADFGNGNTETDKNVNRKQRITIDCTSGGVYCELTKIVLRISSEGATGCKCLVECGDHSNETVWTTVADTPVYGWDGWNVVNLNSIQIGANKPNTYKYVRLTFSIEGLYEGYHNSLRILGLRFVSRNCYNDTINKMASRGTIYNFDRDQNVTFPKNLAIKGNVLTIGNTTITEAQLKSLLALL